MRIGYTRVSKADGSQSLDLQRDALRAEGIDDAANLYHDFAFGVRDDRPGLDSCLSALRKDDVLVVWKLDLFGRNLAHRVNTVQDLSARGVGLRVLAGQSAQIDTTTAAGTYRIPGDRQDGRAHLTRRTGRVAACGEAAADQTVAHSHWERPTAQQSHCINRTKRNERHGFRRGGLGQTSGRCAG